MSVLAVQIVDLRAGKPGKPIDAALHIEVSVEDVLAAEAAWKIERFRVAHDLLVAGVKEEDLPMHWRWDWAKKAPALRYLANRAFGIQCEGQWQGLMMTTTVGHAVQLKEDYGKPLLYVKYVESAPWNLIAMTPKPHFGAIGTRLLEAAVRQSLDEGFHGRIGLHALPNPATEGFYQAKGLLRLGIDAAVEDLPYYEMTREAAARFLSGGKP
jgi:hypothetical protein